MQAEIRVSVRLQGEGKHSKFTEWGGREGGYADINQIGERKREKEVSKQ